MAIKSYTLTLDMEKVDRSPVMVSGRMGDKDSIKITANLTQDGAPYTPTGANAYFECINNAKKAVRVPAVKGTNSVSVNIPAEALVGAGVVQCAYFRFETGTSSNPTLVESTQSFGIIVEDSIDDKIDADHYIAEWRDLADQLQQQVDEVKAAATKAKSDIKADVDAVEAVKVQAAKDINADVTYVEDQKSAAKTAIDADVSEVESYKVSQKKLIDADVAEVETKKTQAVHDIDAAVDLAESEALKVTAKGDAAINAFNTKGNSAVSAFNTNGDNAVSAFNTKGDKAIAGLKQEVHGASMTVGTVSKGDNAAAAIKGDPFNWTLDMTLPKGDKGDSFKGATASVDANVGTPSVEVTASGSGQDKMLNFKFKNLKGETGNLDTGATVPVSRGGTGASTVKGARHNLLSDMTIVTDDAGDDHWLVSAAVPGSVENGAVVKRKLSTLTNWVISKVKSTFGFDSRNLLPVKHGGTGGNSIQEASQILGFRSAVASSLKNLTTGYDLNSMTVFSGYYVASVEVYKSLVNKPVDAESSAVIWLDSSNPSMYVQHVVLYHKSIEYIRMFVGGAFAKWKVVSRPIQDVLGVDKGGTGVTTAAAERNRLGLGNTTGPLPVANGGTGQSDINSVFYSIASKLFNGEVDLNDLHTPDSVGMYSFNTNYDNISNRPEGTSAFGIVIVNKGFSYSSQMYYDFADVDTATLFIRLHADSTGWTSWKKVFLSSDVIPISSGGTGATTPEAARRAIGAGTSNFSGAYSDLSGKPTLFSGSYNDLTNKPALFSGNYNDLTNKPVIPSMPSTYDMSKASGMLAVTHGGTGATDATTARSKLGINPKNCTSVSGAQGTYYLSSGTDENGQTTLALFNEFRTGPEQMLALSDVMSARDVRDYITRNSLVKLKAENLNFNYSVGAYKQLPGFAGKVNIGSKVLIVATFARTKTVSGIYKLQTGEGMMGAAVMTCLVPYVGIVEANVTISNKTAQTNTGVPDGALSIQSVTTYTDVMMTNIGQSFNQVQVNDVYLL